MAPNNGNQQSAHKQRGGMHGAFTQTPQGGGNPRRVPVHSYSTTPIPPPSTTSSLHSPYSLYAGEREATPSRAPRPSAAPPRTESPIPAPKVENATPTPTPPRTAHLPPSIRPDPGFSSTSMSNLVTFTIGTAPTEQVFKIHKAFVCQYSPVLRSAFNSNYLEGTTQSYRLEDTQPAAFALFSQWLYTQTITGPGVSYDGAFFQSLTHLWVLAEKFVIPVLQNLVVDWLVKVRHCHGGPAVEMLGYVYGKTGEESQLRRLFVAFCAGNVGVEGYIPGDRFPQVMLLDLAMFFKMELNKRCSDPRSEVAGGAFGTELDAAEYYVKKGLERG